jgi:uncharacterized protein (DUF58 family)
MWFRRILNAKSKKDGSPSRQRTPEHAQNWLLSARALRQLNRLKLNTHPFVPGYSAGERSSQRRRPASDFREHRMYTPGDDVRFVDWKASARQEHIFIKQGEQLKNATISILVDCSASMSWGDPSKQRAALSLAAALAYLGLAHRDRMLLTPLAPERKGLGPLTGKSQFPMVMNYLRSISFQGEIDLSRSIRTFSRKSVAWGGLALVISDLLGVEDLRDGLSSLPAPTWQVVVLHLLHPLEIQPELQGDFKMQDIETGQSKNYTVTPQALVKYQARLQAWQQELEEVCRDHKCIYLPLSSGWTMESQVLPRLRAANVIKPL